jgi:hypothetical protein
MTCKRRGECKGILLLEGPVLGVQGVVWPLELDDIVLLIGKQWRIWLAGAKLGERFPGISALGSGPQVYTDGGSVLASLGVYPAQLCGMAFEVSLCRHSAHATAKVSPGCAFAA